MPALRFFKWSPGGNTTLLFPGDNIAPQEQTRLAVAALDAAMLGGEQAGFFNALQKTLRMAGGEFCVNASRAAGAMLAYCVATGAARKGESAQGVAAQPGEEPLVYEDTIHVSGWETPIRLRARGVTPQWRVEAELQVPACPVASLDKGIQFVRLPGICHLLLDARLHSQPEDCFVAASTLRHRYGLEDEAASGVIWWQEHQGQLTMLPLVHVRDAGTTCLENACGSGALALGMTLAAAGTQTAFSIMQPGGTALDVRFYYDGQVRMAGIDGPVSLLAKGTVWLPDAQESSGALA